MAQFTYTLPSGSQFTMYAPQGTTQALADYVFYSQVAAGSLVGYTAGQTLSAPSTKLANFALSRQDRDTAGVPNNTILAIISGSPIVAPVPNLTSVPLTSPITGADYVAVNPPLGVNSVGPLTPPQVQALVAQISNLVDQPANVITAQVGIGQYGLNCPQLEQAGYVVPGTYDTYLKNNPGDFVSVMSAPGIFTGLAGVNSVQDLLNDPVLQTQIQTQIMQNSYDSLTAAGVIQSSSPQPPSLSTAQVYTQNSDGSGALQTASTVALLAGEIGLSGGLNSIIGNAVGSGSSIGSTVSNAFSSLSSVSLDSLGNSLAQTASSLTTTIAGDVGALVTNASQFGTAVTSLWANGSNLSGLTSSLTSSLSNINLPDITSLTNSLGLGTLTTGLTSSLNSLTSTGLNTLTGGLSSLSSGLSSSLSGITGSLSGVTDQLTSGALSLSGDLSDLASGALGSATDLVQGSLGQLTDLASGTLGSLGSSLDVFGSMSQFSVNFSLLSSDSLVSTTQPAPGYSNTVDRQTVDAALTRIIGNPLVESPLFNTGGGTNLGASADITQAQNILKSISGTANQLLNGSASIINTAQNAAKTVTSATTALSTNGVAVSKLFG